MNDPTGLLSKMVEWFLKNITGSNLAICLFLSKEEKEILKEATGEIYKLSADQTGAFVRAGNRNFYFEDNIEKTIIYNEGLDRLIRKGLVVHEFGQLFKLTSKGYRVSKKLK